MSERPWLSILMPIHNGEPYLPATLRSISAEDLTGVEILAFDSSPTDNCRALIETWSPRLPVVYRHVPGMKSWTAKTNRAAEKASAPHICMLHQDDLWLPGHVNAVRASLEEAKHAVMSVAASRFIDATGRDIGKWSQPFKPGIRPGIDFGRALIVQNFLAIPSPVIRRDAWISADGLDEDLWYTADWDLYLKLAQLGDVTVRSAVTTGFRIHGNSLTMTGSRTASAFREQHEIVLRRHGDKFGLDRDHRLRGRARASAEINCGLASAAAGHAGSLLPIMRRLLALGPNDAWYYLRESSIIDRLLPRLRARLMGRL